MLCRAELFNQDNYFSTSLKVGEYIDWFSRVSAQGVTDIVVPKVVLRRRIHDSNTTRTTALRHEHYLSLIKDKLRREGKLSS